MSSIIFSRTTQNMINENSAYEFRRLRKLIAEQCEHNDLALIFEIFNDLT